MRGFVNVGIALVLMTAAGVSLWQFWIVPANEKRDFETEVNRYLDDVEPKTGHRIFYIAGFSIPDGQRDVLLYRMSKLDGFKRYGSSKFGSPGNGESWNNVSVDMLTAMMRAQERKVAQRNGWSMNDTETHKVAITESPVIGDLATLQNRVAQIETLTWDISANKVPLAERRAKFEKLKSEVDALLEKTKAAEPLDDRKKNAK